MLNPTPSAYACRRVGKPLSDIADNTASLRNVQEASRLTTPFDKLQGHIDTRFHKVSSHGDAFASGVSTKQQLSRTKPMPCGTTMDIHPQAGPNTNQRRFTAHSHRIPVESAARSTEARSLVMSSTYCRFFFEVQFETLHSGRLSWVVSYCCIPLSLTTAIKAHQRMALIL